MATQGRRRALGQHFLRDESIAAAIADAAIAQAVEHGCPALLEIGPGKGAITFPLMERLERAPSITDFILSERDPILVNEWTAGKGPYRIEAGDFLDLPEERWLSKTPLAVASNLPYSAGTAILVRLAYHPTKIPFMVLMFQAEVARRLYAEPSTKAWGSLSVWVQNRWDVKKLLHVPPRAFMPPPQVDSEVVLLTARATPRIEVGDDPESEKAWDGLIRGCFAHRRKMLRSGLPSGSPWRNALEQSGLDGTKRAEALSWDEWQRLYEALKRLQRK